MHSEDSDQTGRTDHFIGLITRRLNITTGNLKYKTNTYYATQLRTEMFIVLVEIYRIKLKISDTRKCTVITLKFEQGGSTIRVVRPKDADGMANRSSLIWVYTVCQDLSVWKLRIFTVFTPCHFYTFVNFQCKCCKICSKGVNNIFVQYGNLVVAMTQHQSNILPDQVFIYLWQYLHTMSHNQLAFFKPHRRQS